jgi:actin-related protein 8
LKIGFSTDQNPILIPHCILLPKNKNENERLNYCATDYNKNLIQEDFELIESIKQKEFYNLRKELLVKRNILKKDCKEDEIYFEEIQITEKEHPNKNTNEEDKNKDSEKNKLNDENKEDIEKNKFSVKIGKEAIESYNTEKNDLLYPIRGGHFNITNERTYVNVLEFLEIIWKETIKNELKIPENEFKVSKNNSHKDYKIILVLIDEIQGIEIKWFCNLILKNLKFKSILINQESVMAAFGAGVTNVCVVTLNEDFTSIGIVEEGFCEKESTKYLPYGFQFY